MCVYMCMQYMCVSSKRNSVWDRSVCMISPVDYHSVPAGNDKAYLKLSISLRVCRFDAMFGSPVPGVPVPGVLVLQSL